MTSLSQNDAALLADDVNAFWKELMCDQEGMDADAASRLTEVYLRGRMGMPLLDPPCVPARIPNDYPACHTCGRSLLAPINEGSTGACRVCGR